MKLISRAAEVLEGFAHYGNPIEIVLQRVLRRNGEMTIVDRGTNVSVRSLRRSYHMFGTTWYTHDYDVAGCPIRRHDVVVDIGANQGFFTCYAAQRGAKVYAFEPNPETFERLNRNIARNGYPDQVEATCAAIGGFDGETTLFCSSFLDGGADTIDVRHAKAVTRRGKNERELLVQLRCLASAIPADLKVRLLKMDCEGAELVILKDLPNPNRFDSIAIEFHPDAYRVDSLIQILLNYGTHQVYAVHSHIIHAIHNDVLLEYARSIN